MPEVRLSCEEINDFKNNIIPRMKEIINKKVVDDNIKNNPNFIDELKENGELKYSLQELMFINLFLDNSNDVLFNIIGANQSSHVLKVEELLKENYDLRSRF